MVAGLLAVGIGAGLVLPAPDVRRYMKISSM